MQSKFGNGRTDWGKGEIGKEEGQDFSFLTPVSPPGHMGYAGLSVQTGAT